MRIETIVNNTRSIAIGQTHPFTRYNRNLRELGYEFGKSGDVLMIQTSMIQSYSEILESNRPVILLDDSASTGTHKFIHMQKNESVIGYIKKQLLKDKQLYKTKFPRSRYHYYMISKYSNNLRSETKLEDITNETLSKVYLGWNLGTMNRYGIQVRKKPSFENRNIDIHFSIKTKYVTKEELDNIGEIDDHYKFHRIQCQKEVERISKKYKYSLSGICKKEEYIKKMNNSKVCISPLGLGEQCFRDFEEISYGAILIKPDCLHMDSWPNIYQPDITYIPCKWDFSDLEEILSKVLSNYKKYASIADNAFNVLQESWRSEVFCNFFDSLMKEITYVM